MPTFEIHRCLGRGGFGEVYRGVMSRQGGVTVDVAIKVLRADLAPSSQGVQRLRDEGRLLGRLTHPTILRVYDLVVVEGRAALITEFVDGADLAQIIKNFDRPTPRAVFEVVAQVGAALDAAWSWPSVTDGQPLHLVHRDIKPDNIRLEKHGIVKLLDFGIAQAKSVSREAETSVNVIMGSTQYLAPERMVQQEVGPESDVFALGCTLYEALTGRALFHRKSMRQMYILMVEQVRFDAFINEQVDELRELLQSDRAIALLKAMLSYQKVQRPTSGEVAARCDAISDSMPGLTLRRWARRRTWEAPPPIEGPLEGFVFTSMQALPAAEGASTLALNRPMPELPPEKAPTIGAPERAPVLGEIGADPMNTEEEEVHDLALSQEGPAPWTAAEMVALYQEEEEAPTQALRRVNPAEEAAPPALDELQTTGMDLSEIMGLVERPRSQPEPVVTEAIAVAPPEAPFAADAHEDSEVEAATEVVEEPATEVVEQRVDEPVGFAEEGPTLVEPAPVMEEQPTEVPEVPGFFKEAPAEDEALEALEDSDEGALEALEDSDEGALEALEDSDEGALEAQADAEASDPEQLVDTVVESAEPPPPPAPSVDDYVPQPGDIDLSDLLPSGKPTVRMPKPERKRRRRAPPPPPSTATRGTVAFLSSVLGMVVGASIFGVLVLVLLWVAQL